MYINKSYIRNNAKNSVTFSTWHCTRHWEKTEENQINCYICILIKVIWEIMPQIVLHLAHDTEKKTKENQMDWYICILINVISKE